MSTHDQDLNRRISEQSQRLRVGVRAPFVHRPAQGGRRASGADQRMVVGVIVAIGAIVMLILLFSATGGGGSVGSSGVSGTAPVAAGETDGAAAAEMVVRFWLASVTGDVQAMEACLASSALPILAEVLESLEQQRMYYEEESSPIPTMG